MSEPLVWKQRVGPQSRPWGAIAAQESIVVVASGATLHVLNPESLGAVRTIPPTELGIQPSATITSLSLAPGGQWVAFSCGKTVGIAPTGDGTPVILPKEHQANVTSLCWGSTSDILYAGDAAGTVLSYAVDVVRLFRRGGPLSGYAEMGSKLVLKEGHPISQLHGYGPFIVASSGSKAAMYDSDTNTTAVIGRQPNRRDALGGCFLPTLVSPPGASHRSSASSSGRSEVLDSGAGVYVSRSGGRLWIADSAGTVQKTVTLAVPPRTTLFPSGEQVGPCNVPPLGLGTLLPVAPSVLLSWTRDSIIIIDVATGTVTAHCINPSQPFVACHVAAGKVYVATASAIWMAVVPNTAHPPSHSPSRSARTDLSPTTRSDSGWDWFKLKVLKKSRPAPAPSLTASSTLRDEGVCTPKGSDDTVESSRHSSILDDRRSVRGDHLPDIHIQLPCGGSFVLTAPLARAEVFEGGGTPKPPSPATPDPYVEQLIQVSSEVEAKDACPCVARRWVTAFAARGERSVPSAVREASQTAFEKCLNDCSCSGQPDGDPLAALLAAKGSLDPTACRPGALLAALTQHGKRTEVPRLISNILAAPSVKQCCEEVLPQGDLAVLTALLPRLLLHRPLDAIYEMVAAKGAVPWWTLACACTCVAAAVPSVAKVVVREMRPVVVDVQDALAQAWGPVLDLLVQNDWEYGWGGPLGCVLDDYLLVLLSLRTDLRGDVSFVHYAITRLSSNPSPTAADFLMLIAAHPNVWRYSAVHLLTATDEHRDVHVAFLEARAAREPYRSKLVSVLVRWNRPADLVRHLAGRPPHVWHTALLCALEEREKGGNGVPPGEVAKLMAKGIGPIGAIEVMAQTADRAGWGDEAGETLRILCRAGEVEGKRRAAVHELLKVVEEHEGEWDTLPIPPAVRVLAGEEIGGRARVVRDVACSVQSMEPGMFKQPGQHWGAATYSEALCSSCGVPLWVSTVILLSCGHAFHAACVGDHPEACPLCIRRTLTTLAPPTSTPLTVPGGLSITHPGATPPALHVSLKF
eukprot:Sspe_Gene.62264::Locus_34862_Transcript_1_1_Confidence_1.000_Length_3224::g.62264::m.62264